MKYLVIYKSISGFTKKYAEWIADELHADISPLNQFLNIKLVIYDVIIFGGSLHVVGINGISYIKKNFGILKDKKIIVFATGASPIKHGILTEILDNNFSEDQKNHISFFYLRGGFDYSKLNFKNKLLMLLLKIKIKLKPEKKQTSDEKGMLEAFNTPKDYTKRENISELIKTAKK